jgi:TolB-like protein/tetratricopeptide (TPR) repeat protein
MTTMITFAEQSFDISSGVLRGPGGPVPLSQRAAALLAALANADGQAVSKANLMEAAWPGQIVEEGNLTVQIAALRKAIGEDWIITVPRVDYRLLKQNGPDPAQSKTIILPSLAVLPFANLSGDPEQDYFAEGVVEDIITALSRFKSFAVIARNSTFAYKGMAVDVRQVAKDLGVRYVLEGSVRRAGKKLRITAKLVDGHQGGSLWAQNFDGTPNEIFDFQDHITASVALLVEPQIQRAEIEQSKRERPKSMAVHDLYLRALHKLLTEVEADQAEAYALLQDALKLEPENALVLAEIVSLIDIRYTQGKPLFGAKDKENCGELTYLALRNANGDSTVMAHCGVTLLQTVKDYDLGMAVMQAAVEANPNSLMVVMRTGVGHLLCGSIERAHAYFQRSVELSPSGVDAHYPLTGIAHAYMVTGDYALARAWALRSLAHNANYDPTYWMLVASHAHLGRIDEARKFLGALQVLTPGLTVSKIRLGQASKDPARLASILEGLRLAGLPEE